MSWETEEEEEDLARSERSGKRERRRIARTLSWASMACLFFSFTDTVDELWRLMTLYEETVDADLYMPLLGWAQNWPIKKKRPWWPNQAIYTLPKGPTSKLGGQLQLLALGIQESSIGMATKWDRVRSKVSCPLQIKPNVSLVFLRLVTWPKRER